MKKALIVSLLSLTVLFAGLTGLASAVDVVITAAVPNVFSVTIDSGAAVSFPLDADSLATGTPVAGSVPSVIRVKSNRLFSFSHEAANFVGLVPANVLPVSNMTYSTVSSDDTIAGNFVAGVTQLHASHSRGNQTFTTAYTLTADLNVEPDTYSTTVTYSAVQN